MAGAPMTRPQSPCLLGISGCPRKPPACPAPEQFFLHVAVPVLGPGGPGLGVSTAADVAPRGEWLPQASHLGS